MAQPNSDDALIVEIGLTEREYLRSLARLEKRMHDSAKRQEEAFRKSNRNVGHSFRQVDQATSRLAGGGLRQVSLQLSQVAQQGAATGNYLQALSLQAADLGILFGGVGIAVGALVSALGPLAIEMIRGADAGAEMEESLKGLEAALSRLEAAQSRAGTSVLDLQDQYAGLTTQAQRLFEIERQIAELRATEAFDTATRSIADGLGVGGALDFDPSQIGALTESLAALREERRQLAEGSANFSDAEFAAANRRIQMIDEEISSLQRLGSNLDDLAEMLGITEAEAGQVAQRFAEIGQAEGAQAQANAMIELVDYIKEVSGNLSSAEEEGKALYDQLIDAATAALELSSIDMATTIGAGADQAARLAGNLWDSASALAAYNANIGRGRGGDPRLYGGSAEDIQREVPSAQLAYRPGGAAGVAPLSFGSSGSIRAGSGGSGGGSRSGGSGAGRSGGGAARKSEAEREAEEEMNRLLAERDRILRDLETPAQEYERSLADLNKLQQMGEISTAKYNAALAKLDEELMRAEFGVLMDGIESVSDAMANAIVNGENMGDALAGVFRQIAADILSAGIREALMSVFKVAGSGEAGEGPLGGILSAIAASLRGGSRAAGGHVRAGRVHKVGENGEELFVPEVNGRILSTAQAQAALRGGGSGGSAVVNMPVTIVNKSGAEVSAQRTGQGGLSVHVVDRMMDDYFERGRGDRALRRRYGVRARPQGT